MAELPREQPGDLFGDLIGQERAVGALRAAVSAPVHAYLLVGPLGSGRRRAAVAFAGALLCDAGGCGTCHVCVRATAEVHPDLVMVERQGASMSIAQAREVRRMALRTPVEGRRKILVLTDFHLATDAGPALLKVVEEPPASTIFVIVADSLPSELATIASRCVTIEFDAVPPRLVAEVLSAEGVAPEVAAEVAEAAGGRLDRARLLARDPEFRARREMWRTLPQRLDGTGAGVAMSVAEVIDTLGRAAVAPLQSRHQAELAELEERVAGSGERGSGRKELADRHRRELKRLRTDEVRSGLGVLAGVYRDELVRGAASGQAMTEALRALEALQATAEALVRNPTETLLLQALFLRLPPLGR